MGQITNAVSSGSTNTATDLIAAGHLFKFVRVFNMHASATIVVNVGAAAASTGTIAGIVIAASQSVVLPVSGQVVSMASGTASVPVAYFEEPWNWGAS